MEPLQNMWWTPFCMNLPFAVLARGHFTESVKAEGSPWEEPCMDFCKANSAFQACAAPLSTSCSLGGLFAAALECTGCLLLTPEELCLSFRGCWCGQELHLYLCAADSCCRLFALKLKGNPSVSICLFRRALAGPDLLMESTKWWHTGSWNSCCKPWWLPGQINFIGQLVKFRE